MFSPLHARTLASSVKRASGLDAGEADPFLRQHTRQYLEFYASVLEEC